MAARDLRTAAESLLIDHRVHQCQPSLLTQANLQLCLSDYTNLVNSVVTNAARLCQLLGQNHYPLSSPEARSTATPHYGTKHMASMMHVVISLSSSFRQYHSTPDAWSEISWALQHILATPTIVELYLNNLNSVSCLPIDTCHDSWK